MSESSKVALVTGGSRGIGRAIVRDLAENGWQTAFTYAGRADAAAELVAELESAGRSCLAYQADVRDFGRCTEVVEDVQKRLGPIDLLVNNAGIKKDEPLYRMSPETWGDVIATNLNGTFNYCRAVVMDMIKKNHGVIVNMVSVSGILGLAGQANYAASKAGVIGMTKSLSREVARFGIRVNALAPGFIETEMLQDMPEATRKKLFAQIPSGTPGTVEQIAGVVRFLASDAAAYITGQVLPVDGGMV